MKTLLIIFICSIPALLISTIINIPDDLTTIQEGINNSVDGDTVLVQPGTYFENINFNGKAITVASLFLTTQDTTYISQTIIDGSQPANPDSASVITFCNEEDSTAVLTGFTIINGFGRLSFWGRQGGGIWCSGSNPYLNNLIVINNTAAEGGGIWCSVSNLYLNNLIVINNTANMGAGIFSEYGSLKLFNLTISNNSEGAILSWWSSISLENVSIDENSGGGIICDDSNLNLINVSITNNYNDFEGGGIGCYGYSELNLINVILSDNLAGIGGAILCWGESNIFLTNTTLTGNQALENGSGIYCWGSATLIDCILWDNTIDEIYFSPVEGPNSITISYSDIQGGEEGIVTNDNGTVFWLEGNIDEDPFFVETGDHPYSLQDISPCINTGIPDTTGLYLPEVDLVGNPRVYGGRIDMGAYENQNVVVEINEDIIPLITALHQNYPNPFNPAGAGRSPRTTIRYQLSEISHVLISIFNIKGQLITTLVDEMKSAGEYSIIWNGVDQSNQNVPSGIYLYRLKTKDDSKIKKMILLR